MDVLRTHILSFPSRVIDDDRPCDAPLLHLPLVLLRTNTTEEFLLWCVLVLEYSYRRIRSIKVESYDMSPVLGTNYLSIVPFHVVRPQDRYLSSEEVFFRPDGRLRDFLVFFLVGGFLTFIPRGVFTCTIFLIPSDSTSFVFSQLPRDLVWSFFRYVEFSCYLWARVVPSNFSTG